MNVFEDFESQDLGTDFVFESDPNSLKRILDNKELSPRSVLAMRMSSKLIQPTLSPAKGAPRKVRENPECYDFFESKKGDIFWRPKTPKSNSNQKMKTHKRALGRVNVNALPQRWAPIVDNVQDPLRTTMSSRKPLIINPNRNIKGKLMALVKSEIPICLKNYKFDLGSNFRKFQSDGLERDRSFKIPDLFFLVTSLHTYIFKYFQKSIKNMHEKLYIIKMEKCTNRK